MKTFVTELGNLVFWDFFIPNKIQAYRNVQYGYTTKSWKVFY